jgi:CheY-like chemotaxis protein
MPVFMMKRESFHSVEVLEANLRRPLPDRLWELGRGEHPDKFKVKGRDPHSGILKMTTTILIIEDEPIVGDALKTVLCDFGYEVVVATTGCEGLERASIQKFDFTITDFRLPDMTGLEVLSKIREKDPCSRILLITAFSTPEIIAESKKLGAIDVLDKPFFPSDVLGLLGAPLQGEDRQADN